MKPDDNPMSPAQRLQDAPRCHAVAKSTGQPCKAPAVSGWTVCRVHGARGGHSGGSAHPSWKHGMRSQEWIVERRQMSELVREAQEIERTIWDG